MDIKVLPVFHYPCAHEKLRPRVAGAFLNNTRPFNINQAPGSNDGRTTYLEWIRNA